MKNLQKKCSCPIGTIKFSCPFSYANGWHAQRDAMFLQTDTETARASITAIAAMSPEELAVQAEGVDDYLLE